MPQININEIDQSVFSRVINDDRVRVLVPGIASFGPVYDGTNSDDTAVTFTDVTEFDKVFGYTEPEYNPFPNDVSRTYAKQLINRGAAVSFIRVNQGVQAIYNMGDTNEGREVSPAATHSPNYYIYSPVTFTGSGSSVQPAWAADTYYTKYNNVYTVTTTKPDDWGTGSYYTRAVNEAQKFCSQITGISAKYTGSFGNHLLVTFTPVTSININFASQYSVVTVYNADILVNSIEEYVLTESAPTNWNTAYTDYYTRTGDSYPYTYTQVEAVATPPTWAANTYYKKEYVTTKTITGVHKLEDHIVTTNPNDVNYVEDVIFNYITINVTPTARDEFTIVWSNLGNTDSGTNIQSGFPEIPLKYLDNYVAVYNEDALLDGGYDFTFKGSLISVLDTGYQTIRITSGTKFTIENVNEYIAESYAPFARNTAASGQPDNSNPGIVPTILDNIKNCYQNYSDPYIYDFDFITTGGFINENFVVTNSAGNVITSAAAIRAESAVVTCKSDRLTNEVVPSGITPIHAGMLELVRTRKDCIALADVNPGWRADDLPQYVEYLNESQCAVHSPWCYTADPFNNNALTLMPPSFVFLYTLLSNLINSPDSQKWFPPAGVTRATARVVVKPKYEIGSVLLNKWQNNTLARVNPIMKLKNYGYVIYGQYTTYVAIDQFTHSALESLNVRLVSNCVKKQIFNLCLKLAFEPNNSSLWFKFYDGMDKYLLFMKRNDGVYDYRIQMDESTVTTDDINELRCPGKVWINPTRTAEFFDIDFILTEAGVTFNEEGE